LLLCNKFLLLCQVIKNFVTKRKRKNIAFRFLCLFLSVWHEFLFRNAVLYEKHFVWKQETTLSANDRQCWIHSFGCLLIIYCLWLNWASSSDKKVNFTLNLIFSYRRSSKMEITPWRNNLATKWPATKWSTTKWPATK
jgi:hypothetical protein